MVGGEPKATVEVKAPWYSTLAHTSNINITTVPKIENCMAGPPYATVSLQHALAGTRLAARQAWKSWQPTREATAQ